MEKWNKKLLEAASKVINGPKNVKDVQIKKEEIVSFRENWN